MANQELQGKTFGRWTALNDHKTENGRLKWLCRCQCGAERYVDVQNLIRGRSTSCGCLSLELNKQRADDLTGHIFGELTVVSRAENQKGRVAWNCECSCGAKCTVAANYLKQGKTKTCGAGYHRIGISAKNLAGMKKGFIDVLEQTERRNAKGSVIWRCLCTRCGQEIFLSADVLRHGGNISCGCYRQENIRAQVHNTLHFIDDTCVELIEKRKSRKDNTSGFRGVYLKHGKWTAQITFQKVTYRLGYFKSFEEAVKARIEAEERLHKPFLEAYYRTHKKDGA